MMPSASLSLVFFYSIASTLMHSLNSHTHHFIALISHSHHSRRRLTDAQIARTVALVAGSSGMLCTQVAPDIGAGDGAIHTTCGDAAPRAPAPHIE